MGLGAKASASRDRYSNDEWQNTTQQNNSKTNTAANTAGTTSTDATFGSPQGKSILDALTGQIVNGNGADYTNTAAGAFTRAANGGGVNPYVEGIISAGNKEADNTFANRLAQTRAAGYRGGTASNINNQEQLASNFTNNQAGQNANLRYGAYNDAAGRELSGAAGLASLGGQQTGLGAQILALLRGQTTNTNQQQNVESTTLEDIIKALTGGSSGTKSGTSGSAGFSFGTGGG